eukprot:TRINITY_DN982_c0_g1_i2.p1 TRINITY_DN982_c0_g1~~TRINITY_DN982_c0_g1_i2.p1  ORF type:complete len:200 (-),score=46.99 TRINITY_DN982_c0_g1_i2:374-973(-)
MCIRDRYQRRVHGDIFLKKSQSQSKILSKSQKSAMLLWLLPVIIEIVIGYLYPIHASFSLVNAPKDKASASEYNRWIVYWISFVILQKLVFPILGFLLSFSAVILGFVRIALLFSIASTKLPIQDIVTKQLLNSKNFVELLRTHGRKVVDKLVATVKAKQCHLPQSIPITSASAFTPSTYMEKEEYTCTQSYIKHKTKG